MSSSIRRLLLAASAAMTVGIAVWWIAAPESGLAAAALTLSAVIAFSTLAAPGENVPSPKPVAEECSAEDARSPQPQREQAQPSEAAPTHDERDVFVKAPQRLDCSSVLYALLENARQAGPAGSAHLWLEDAATSTLRLVAATGPLLPAQEPIPSDSGPLGEALRQGTSVMRPSTRYSDGMTETTVWRYAVPVRAGEARGLAAIDFASEQPPDAEALNLVSAVMRGPLAGCLALHLAKHQSDAAEILLEMARELSRMLEPDEVVHAALTKAMALSDAETGSVMLLDEATGTMRIAEARGLPREVVDATEVSEGEGIAGWVLASRQPLLVEDLQGRGRHARRHGVRSAMSIPIADEDGVLGVINVGSRTFPARFTSSHMAALEVLARQTAAALRNARAVSSSRELYFATLKALALALETKDPYSNGATERVLEYASALGRRMNLDEVDQQALEIAALLHDIGMTAAGESLTADRPLSTVERGILKMHPLLAVEILEQAPALRSVIPIVYHHHEWYDGTGYVGGVAGEAIPLGARILSVADAFVAMTSPRPYRRPLSVRDALDELQGKSGTQFDPEVVSAFRDVVRAQPADLRQ